MHAKNDMIKRIWQGWARPENADAYEDLVRRDVFPAIADEAGTGFLGAELFRLNLDNEVEFMTVMSFDAIDTIKRLAGEDVTLAYVPDKARTLLSHWDERARHFKLQVEYKT